MFKQNDKHISRVSFTARRKNYTCGLTAISLIAVDGIGRKYLSLSVGRMRQR
jgi:hypothetical protein